MTQKRGKASEPNPTSVAWLKMLLREARFVEEAIKSIVLAHGTSSLGGGGDELPLTEAANVVAYLSDEISRRGGKK